MFQEEEIGKLLAKNIVGTARRQLDERICYLENIFFAELNNFLSPKLADKPALSKMTLTLMEESMF